MLLHGETGYLCYRCLDARSPGEQMSTTTGALSISRRGMRVHGRLYNIHMYSQQSQMAQVLNILLICTNTSQSKRKHLHKHIKDDPIQHLAMACDVIIKHKKVLEDNDKLLTKHSENIQVCYC